MQRLARLRSTLGERIVSIVREISVVADAASVGSDAGSIRHDPAFYDNLGIHRKLRFQRNHLRQFPPYDSLSLLPDISVEHSVVDGFVDVIGLDGVVAVEVGDGARDAEDLVVSSSR